MRGEKEMTMHRHRLMYLLSAGLCALALNAATAAPALTAPVELPPLVDPASAEHHVGKMIWADLTTPDLGVSKRFYSGLLGWTFRDIHMGKTEYVIALLDGRPVGGLVHRTVPAGDQSRPAWLAFIAVRDVDATKRIALENGAKVVSEPRTYPQRGRQAVFTDPEGAAFGVMASSSGDPADFLAAPGEWIWSSLLAREADKAAAFYQTLFGYEVFDLPIDDGLEHDILSTDDYARASVNTLPNKSPRRHSHWLNFVRVTDTATSAAKVIALGGRVLVEPHVDRHGAMVAVVADPSGAHFGLMEWSNTDAKEDPK
jgi:predicted enzyme related to lactoylglutathione lyase